MRTRDERRGENQERFRLANERLDSAVGEAVDDAALIPFLCECADDMCLDRAELTQPEYEDVRSGTNRFLIIPGHLTVAGERVVGDYGRFAVVEKAA